ncbi:MAG TPA: Rap1a/Tai family immunity protein [Stellaceae bacterium]|nr:Rap1a/Tai family immunity protein [Stellaceae bacterium]
MILAGLSLFGAAAQAKVRDGNQLLQQCTATIGAHVNFCFGYIDSVVDLLVLNNVIDGINVCLWSELDDPSLRNIVVQFLKDNPKLRGLGAPDLIARALSEAFPCP